MIRFLDCSAGSGKTAAFVWPMIFHVMDQRALKEEEGPIALVCAPTRELAQQIEKECKRFSKPFGITCVCAYGGGSKWEQSNAVKEGCEVLHLFDSLWSQQAHGGIRKKALR